LEAPHRARLRIPLQDYKRSGVKSSDKCDKCRYGSIESYYRGLRVVSSNRGILGRSWLLDDAVSSSEAIWCRGRVGLPYEEGIFDVGRNPVTS
jgi:hypothetical protein